MQTSSIAIPNSPGQLTKVKQTRWTVAAILTISLMVPFGQIAAQDTAETEYSDSSYVVPDSRVGLGCW